MYIKNIKIAITAINFEMQESKELQLYRLSIVQLTFIFRAEEVENYGARLDIKGLTEY